MSDLGEITPSYAITFNRRSKHSAERLWRAIVSPDEVSKWMNNPATIDPRLGGAYYVDFSKHSDGELAGVIVRVEPERRLAYAWGRTVVEWTIESTDDGCAYTLTQTGLQPGEGESAEGYAAGWHGFLEELDMHLEGKYLTREESVALVDELMVEYGTSR